jgi:membrane-associated HD superfamily phosphohydrolase
MDAKSSRLVTTTLLGVVFGIICMLLSKYTDEVAYWPMGVSFLLHHAVMGLVIGVSSLRMNWAVHGIFWGGVFGLFLAISLIDSALEPWQVFIIVIVWGFLIETLTTKAFKRPQ